MSLEFEQPEGFEALAERLSSAVAAFFTHHYLKGSKDGGPALEARLQECIPLFTLDPRGGDGAEPRPNGSWYSRVRVEWGDEDSREGFDLGITAVRDQGGWRINHIEKRDDGLDPILDELDERHASLDSKVGYFRDDASRVSTLYLMDLGLHRIVEVPPRPSAAAERFPTFFESFGGDDEAVFSRAEHLGLQQDFIRQKDLLNLVRELRAFELPPTGALSTRRGGGKTPKVKGL